MNRNLTLNLPETLIHKLRIHAAERNQSMTAVAKEAIEQMVSHQTDRKAEAQRLAEILTNASDRGLGGKIPWTRDELYER